jgi:Flp pilus assembly protein CpaB
MALVAKGSYNVKRKKGSGRRLPLVAVVVAGVLCLVVGLAVGMHVLRAPSDAAVRPEPVRMQIYTTDILVPLDTVQVGVALQPNMFRKEPKPEDQVTGDMLRGFDELKGMYARGVLFKGQPVLKAALTNRQPVHVLTALLPKDYRAVAIEVEKPLLDNVDGWAQPGTDVDVVWITSAFGREMASILAGPVRVLAANKATEWSPSKVVAGQTDKLATVTLLLSVKDAVRVSLAAMNGRISLGLRGLNDKRPSDGARPLSTVVEERAVKSEPEGLLSVKVVDPKSRGTEVRKYDSWGRRISEPKNGS